MKEIQLTKNQIALVDHEDFERLNQSKWYALWSPCTKSYYAIATSDKTLIYMSRCIMNYPNDMMVDHKDHNTLNNQKYNLRVCTQSENKQNSRPHTNSSSKYKGVCWDKSHKKWKAQIGLKDIFDQSWVQYLSHFDEEKEAALENFGEFALLNFPSRNLEE